MKKTVHSRSRSRWLVGGILVLGTVALAATGFSVWVVSNSIVETEGDISINYVDTAENQSVQLNASISETESLTITEKYTEDNYTGSGTCYVTNAGVEDHELDLSVTISGISVTAGSSWLSQNTVSGLEVSIAAWQYQTNETDDEGNYVWANATTKGTDLLGSRSSDSTLTYIELDTNTTKLSFTNNDFATNEGSSNKTYTYSNDWIVNFKWGSFFNNVSPCTYYNTVLNDSEKGVEPTTTNLDKVTTELNTMHDNLSGSLITLTVKLVTSTSTTGD